MKLETDLQLFIIKKKWEKNVIFYDEIIYLLINIYAAWAFVTRTLFLFEKVRWRKKCYVVKILRKQLMRCKWGRKMARKSNTRRTYCPQTTFCECLEYSLKLMELHMLAILCIIWFLIMLNPIYTRCCYNSPQYFVVYTLNYDNFRLGLRYLFVIT